jgi:hypothetical protein
MRGRFSLPKRSPQKDRVKVNFIAWYGVEADKGGVAIGGGAAEGGCDPEDLFGREMIEVVRGWQPRSAWRRTSTLTGTTCLTFVQVRSQELTQELQQC